jgi:hypothetical protein
MKRIWTLCAALLGAVLAVVPGLASAQDLTRKYSIDWQAVSFKSRGSCLHTVLQSEGLPIFSVNDMPLPTYTVGPLFTRPNGDQQNSFRALFGGSLLRWGSNDFFFGVSTTGNGDYCTFAEDTVELNSSGLQPRRLFSVSRQGQPFYGVAPLTLDLREINPTLANSLAALEHAVAIELSRVYNLGPDLATQQARAAQLKALLEEMKQLCQRPLDSITEAELNALLNKYSAVPPGVRQALLQLLTDLKKSVEELRAEIDRIVAEFRGQMDALDRWTLPKPDTSVDLENPDTYEPDLSKDQVPEVEVPDVSADDPFDPDNDPYLAFAEATLTELNKSLSNGVVADRQGFLAMVRLWRFNQDVFERGLQLRIGASQAEWGAFLSAQQRVLSFIRQYMDEGDWFHDSPVRESTKAFVAMLEQRPENAAQAHALKNNLNLWYGGTTPTFEQKLVLDTLDALSAGFASLWEGSSLEDVNVLSTLSSLTDGAIVAAKEVAAIGLSLSPAGDFIDLCEFVTGKEMCNPYGADLQTADRMFAAAGLVIGSGKFWRTVGNHVLPVVTMSERLARIVDKLKDITHAQKEEILDRLGSRSFERMEHLSGQEILTLMNRTLKDASIHKLAFKLNGQQMKELTELKMLKLVLSEDAMAKVASGGTAAKSMSSMFKRSLKDVQDELKVKGFGRYDPLPDGTLKFTPGVARIERGQEIWQHPDLSLVRISLEGTEDASYLHFKKEISARVGAYREKEDVLAKITDSGMPVWSSPEMVRVQMRQWFSEKTGIPVDVIFRDYAIEEDAMKEAWALATHIELL